MEPGRRTAWAIGGRASLAGFPKPAPAKEKGQGFEPLTWGFW